MSLQLSIFNFFDSLDTVSILITHEEKHLVAAQCHHLDVPNMSQLSSIQYDRPAVNGSHYPVDTNVTFYCRPTYSLTRSGPFHAFCRPSDGGLWHLNNDVGWEKDFLSNCLSNEKTFT